MTDPIDDQIRAHGSAVITVGGLSFRITRMAASYEAVADIPALGGRVVLIARTPLWLEKAIKALVRGMEAEPR